MMTRPTARPARTRRPGPLRGAALLGALAAAALAQPGERLSPVFFDDSTEAAATIGSLDGLVASGNEAEGVRALQRLLDDEPERLVSLGGDVFETVRDRVHAILLDSPALLERYRQMAEPAAAERLGAGRHEDVERSRLLTPSGFEAALRVAQEHLEGARFGSARRTLAQLEAHPDRRRQTPGRDAAELALLLASYTGDRTDEARAERWGAEAGVEAAPGRIEPPAARGGRAASSVEGFGPRAEGLGDVVGRPLRSVPLTEPPTTLGEQEAAAAFSQYQAVAWTLPAASGDVLYTNDGLTVSAFDRYTLHPLWRVRTLVDAAEEGRYAPSARRRLGRVLEDASSVTLAGDLVLATTGIATPARRDGDARLHAIDRETGRVRWSVDVATLHDDLAQSTVRGPAQVDGQTVVVAARKSVPNRRLMSVYLVGLDIRSGERRWHRLVATAGSLPFQQFSRVPLACAIADGVVYRVDEMGLAAAVDAHTGRPVWLRRLPAGDPLSNVRTAPWNSSAPIVTGDRLVCLSPDGLSLLALDRRTGRVTGERPLSDVRDPNYLVRVGGHIACVGQDSVAFVPLDDPIGGRAHFTGAIGQPGIRGRVAAAGGLLLVPVDDGTRSGAMIVDPASPRDASFVELDHTGNLLAMPGQIIAVDDVSAHSYLAWESASATLGARIGASPEDAGPAITLAELAWHAGEEARVASAVDDALAALERRPDGASRERLASVVRAMLVVALDPVEIEGRVLHDRSVLGRLVDRLGRLSETPEQRVAHLMLAGRLAESGGDAPGALDAYQGVLEDAALAGASWRGAHLEVRAELEATRRVARLLREHGVGIYEPFARAAARAAGAGERSPGAVASAYPYAGVAPGLWLDEGDALSRAGRPFAAVRAWRAGLASAQTIAQAGGTPEARAASELVGRLVTALADQGRDSEIVSALGAARATFGADFTPTAGGNPLDVDALLRAPERLAGARTRAWIGTHPRIDPTPALLPGTVLEPVRRSGEGAMRRALLVSGARRQLVSVRPDDAEVVATRWTRDIGEGVVPLLLDDADDRVVLVWPANAEGGARLEALDQSSGQTLWNSRPLPDALPGVPGPDPGERMMLPGGEDVALSDIVVAADERTVCLVERTGRVAAYDLRDGSLAWSAQLEVARVADAVLAQGVLVVGGQDRAGDPAEPRPGDPPAPIVVAHDGATGERLQRLGGVGGRIRWLRATRTGDVVVGSDRAVTSVNLVEGRVNWTSAEIDTTGTLDAWVFGDRVLLLTMERRLVGMSAVTGRPDPEPIDARRRITGLAPTRAYDLGGPVALASSRGVIVVGPEGELLGVDALETDAELVPAAAARGVLVTVEHKPLRRPGEPSGELHMLSAESARLLSSAPVRVPEGVDPRPRAVALMDGRILLGYAGVTMVIEAPPTPDTPAR